MTHAFDQNWYRIAGLKPRLRLHAEVHRQHVRGGIWYVLQDHQTGNHFRVSAGARALLGLMDGHRTVSEIVGRLARHLGSERPSRGEALRLLVQLHRADLLATPLPPDLDELDRRSERQARRRLWARLRNPLAIRVPLWDPDRFLTATLPIARALCHPIALVLAAAVVVLGGVLAAMNASALAADVADGVFAADNVLLMILIYPLAKLLHEAGHAYAVKLGGGDVHEVGVMVLVLFPVPYVDASSSAGFPDAWRRALVSAMGILMELILAGLASIAWTLLDPGPERAAALDVMLLCGVSTVAFNGNPLLRFDGYYVLSDLIGLANLDTRSRAYLMHLLRRRVLGMTGEPCPVEAAGEAGWLFAYGIASFAYRMTMLVTIALLIATRMFALGAALALASVAQLLVWPVLRGSRFLLVGRDLRGRRGRALAGAGGVAAALAVALFVLPLPYSLVAPGVVWVPSAAIVRAGADGFVVDIAATPGAEVSPGMHLFHLEDPVAEARLRTLEAEVAVQQSRFDAVNLIDRVQARLLADQLSRAKAVYDREHERIAELDVDALRDGRFVVPNASGLPRRFVHKGDVLGFVLGSGDVEVRAVLSQAELDLARRNTRRVDVLLTERMDRVLPARVARETPSALERAPAPALSPEGGGPMLTDPNSPDRDRPLDRWYEFEIALSDDGAARHIGEHAAVRFDFGGEPVAWRIIRGTRQLLLRTLNL
jgi:putative peptide zinc metalloprotease protein